MSKYDKAKATKKRHKSMVCRVFEIKVDKSRLWQDTIDHLHSLFREAKWLYNDILGSEVPLNFDTKAKTATVHYPTGPEVKEFQVISAQMKQSVKQRIYDSIVGLSALKKKGYKVGWLRFTSHLDSIPLKQHNVTYTVFRNHNYIKLQGVKQQLKVYGLQQIPEGAEICNANLVRREDDFYFLITTYTEKEPQIVPDASIGIDFGCQTQLTLSNGIKVEYQVPPSKRLKRLDRKIMKGNRKRSNNKLKDQSNRRKEYNRITNVKKDIKNKIVHVLTSCYRTICFQDENLRGWQASGHGKKIQSTAIGGIMSAIKTKAHTPVEVDRFYPSTQLCPSCGNKQKLSQEIRVYQCNCGYIGDRDIKAAVMLEREGLKQVPTGRREVKPQEIEAPAFMLLDKLRCISNISVSFCR